MAITMRRGSTDGTATVNCTSSTSTTAAASRFRTIFLTTVDSTGVRTQVDLGRQQCAVVKKIPITIESAGPVNVRVGKYDGRTIELVANAGRSARLTIRGGEFPVRPGSEHLLAIDGRQARVAADGEGSLAISLKPAGQVRIRVTPASER